MGNMGSSEELDALADQIGKSLNVKDDKGGEEPEIVGTDGISTLARWIQKGDVKNVMVLCGAGVSVAAGIPDFRTPGTGLYDNLQKYNLPYPEAVFDVDFYKETPEPFIRLAKELWPGLTHSPTLTHSFLKLLSDKGLLLRNYTQNIDGLEFLAGIPAEKIVECHGHFRTASCTNCHKPADHEKVQNSIVMDGETPKCEHCGGNVKPDIVFFGEQLPARYDNLIRQDIKKADLLLVMGTSLKVAPVSMIPYWVDCNRILFNREQVMTMNSGDFFIEGDCDSNVEKLCDKLGWTAELRKQHSNSQINKDDEEKQP